MVSDLSSERAFRDADVSETEHGSMTNGWPLAQVQNTEEVAAAGNPSCPKLSSDWHFSSFSVSALKGHVFCVPDDRLWEVIVGSAASSCRPSASVCSADVRRGLLTSFRTQSVELPIDSTDLWLGSSEMSMSDAELFSLLDGERESILSLSSLIPLGSTSAVLVSLSAGGRISGVTCSTEELSKVTSFASRLGLIDAIPSECAEAVARAVPTGIAGLSSFLLNVSSSFGVMMQIINHRSTEKRSISSKMRFDDDSS